MFLPTPSHSSAPGISPPFQIFMSLSHIPSYHLLSQKLFLLCSAKYLDLENPRSVRKGAASAGAPLGPQCLGDFQLGPWSGPHRWLLTKWVNEECPALVITRWGIIYIWLLPRFCFLMLKLKLFNPPISQVVSFGWEGIKRRILFAYQVHFFFFFFLCRGEVW